jgi:predicted site-specific integrase-resolvase
MALTLYSRKEAAGILGVTSSSVYKWQKAGKITPSLHINGRPRYSIEEIERLVKIKHPSLNDSLNSSL